MSRCFLSFSGWAALATEEAVSWQAELHCRAEQAELPGHKSFSDRKEKFLSQGRAGGCKTSISAKALISLIPWELLPWLLTCGEWHRSHLLQWINLSCLQTKAPKWVYQHNYWANRVCNHQMFHRNCNICMWGSSLQMNLKQNKWEAQRIIIFSIKFSCCTTCKNLIQKHVQHM